MSGLWLDFKVQSVEDQQKIIAPMNEITETLWYNLRILVDSKLYGEDSENRAWKVSKINRLSPCGITHVTLAQDRYDQYHDFIEKDEDGNIVGLWADWNKSAVPPTSEEPSSELFTSITSRITSPGAAQIRVGGSKTLTIAYYEDGIPVEHEIGEWTFFINGKDATPLLDISYPKPNKVKLKFAGGDEYIGSILTIINTTVDEIISSIDVEIIAF